MELNSRTPAASAKQDEKKDRNGNKNIYGSINPAKIIVVAKAAAAAAAPTIKLI